MEENISNAAHNVQKGLEELLIYANQVNPLINALNNALFLMYISIPNGSEYKKNTRYPYFHRAHNKDGIFELYFYENDTEVRIAEVDFNRKKYALHYKPDLGLDEVFNDTQNVFKLGFNLKEKESLSENSGE